MHLDAIHQNVVKYRLLMERYKSYLLEKSLEMNITKGYFIIKLIENVLSGDFYLIFFSKVSFIKN